MPDKEKKDKKAPPPSPTPPVSTLAGLRAICDQVKRVEFTLDGNQCELPVRRMRPNEEAVISEILSLVVPKITRGKTVEEDRAEYTDPLFIKAKAAAETEARALALYWCVPAFVQDKPDLKDKKEITDYVQGQLNEEVLQILWRAVRNGGVSVAELVNFG
jgi:hypothetical protein